MRSCGARTAGEQFSERALPSSHLLTCLLTYLLTYLQVSNSQSEPCLQRAIEFALHTMQVRGTIKALLKQWMPIASCDDDQPASGTAALDDDGTNSGLATDGAGDGRRWRRLKGSSAAGAGAGAENAAETQFQVADFFGLFAFWAVCTLLVVVVNVTKGYAGKLAQMLRGHRVSK